MFTKHLSLNKALLVLALAVGVSVSAYAEETTTVEELPPGTEIKAVENPKMEEVRSQAEKLAAKLTAEEVQNLAMVRDGFGMIRSVELAQETVEDAIEACSDENPNIADSLEKRHKTWEDAIDTVLDVQEEKFDAVLSDKFFKDPDEIEDYLDAIEDAAEYAESNIKKEIITSESACINLRDSMDNTQETITKMLSEINWPDKELSEDTEDKEG